MRKTGLAMFSMVAVLGLAGFGCTSRVTPAANAPSSTVNTSVQAPTNMPSEVVTGSGVNLKRGFGEDVEFAVGDAVSFPDGMIVRLERIDDSRCKEGDTCVWEGELSPTFHLSGGDFGAGSAEMALGSVRTLSATQGSYAFALRSADATTVTVTVTKTAAQPSAADPISITTPTPNQIVTSPLTVTGKARGPWYFEASFPVRILDANGKVLASGPAQAQGEWTTNDFVPFTVTLTFPQPTTATGTLVLQKDNPSGLPQNADSRKIPIRFQTAK